MAIRELHNMNEKVTPSGNVLRAGKQKRTGRLMRDYINSQIFLPPVDENAAWENNEEE